MTEDINHKDLFQKACLIQIFKFNLDGVQGCLNRDSWKRLVRASG